MNHCAINIGEVKIVDYSTTLVCYGLGSCIALFLRDRVKGIAGGAHILLPASEGALQESNKWYSVSQAITELTQRFHQKGSTLTSLSAKVAGGANTLGCLMDVGEQNSRAVMKELAVNGIYIAAVDVGGNQSRTAHFNTQTGALIIRTGRNYYSY